MPIEVTETHELVGVGYDQFNGQTVVRFHPRWPGSYYVELTQEQTEQLIEELADSIGYIADLRTPREKFADDEARKGREELRETSDGYDHGREERLTEAELAATPYADIVASVSFGKEHGYL